MTPPASGALANGVHMLPVRVYWEDTDAGGIVYHASYVRFMERGRTEMLRALGLDQGRLRKDHDLLYVVSSMSLNFRRAAVFDDSLLVCTHCTKIGGASLALEQSVRRADEILVTANVICAGIGSNGRPRRAPDAVRELLAGIGGGAACG